ncbi:MAG TPA: hypothetical protein VFN74_02315 [Chloroflexota bacterium]|jgi:hypothetical protein|nr:hypothetical protein [Chloroflexota bacterium]
MQAVPLGFFLFLAQFAAGVLIVTTLLDWEGEVSAGYLVLNGIFALLAIGAGLWLRWILPAERLVGFPVPREWLSAEVIAWGLFAALGAVQLGLLRTERRPAGRVAGAATSLAGVASLGVSAVAYGTAAGLAPLLLAAFGLGALALGTVWSGMMLGHWYLVTPLLKPRPLLRLNWALTAALVMQLALTLWPLAAGALGALDGMVQSLYWLRLIVGLVAPLALAWPIWRTARVRSMMSATGLLYVSLGLVLAGQIMACAFYFVSGLAV